MAQWLAIHGIVDGSDVDAETVNRPLFELAERTNYLYNKLDEFTGSALSESVRLFSVPLTTEGALAPNIKDVVTLDRVTGTYCKAVASMSVSDEFKMSNNAFAVGVLIAKSGSTGTVVAQGRLTTATGSNLWLLADMLESGEVFRNGDYYLSAIEPGKITANPSGPVIYLGMFKASDTAAAYGDYAVLSPQFHDLGTAHVHRTYKLHSKPACRQYVTAENTDGIHQLIGFPADAEENYDVAPRLVCYGNWTGPSAVQYTIWLSNYDGTDRSTSQPPTSFENAYIHWISSDPEEPQGRARVWSYEVPVAIGSYGLTVALENASAYTPQTAGDWDVVYDSADDSADKRTWSVTVPDHITGWLARRYRQYCVADVGSNGKFSMLLLGGPRVSDGNKTMDTITAVCGEIHQFDCTTEPDAGDTVTVTCTDPALQYELEFTTDGTVTAEGNIPVLLTGVAAATYENLLTAMLDLDENVTPVLGDTVFIIVTPTGTVVTHAGVEVGVVAPGAGTITGGSSVSLVVFDEDHRNLVAVGDYSDTYFWAGAELWKPQVLSNNLMLMLIPFDSTGASMTSSVVAIGDKWTAEITDRAPGASFEYSMGMHTSLSAHYPPVPAKSAALVLNGAELDSGVFFDNPTYALERDTLYWYPDTYATVPWPADWESVAVEGSDNFAQKMLLHFVRNGGGATGVVTSLRPAAGSPIKITSTSDDDYTGDLTIDVDLAVETEDAGLTGYSVVKGAVGNKLRRGPVVERIVAGAGLALTQSAGAPAGQGVVTLSLATSAAVYTGEFEEVALQNAKQSMIGLFPYVRLLGWRTGQSNTPSAFTAKFRVPHTVEPGQYRVVVHATVFGETTVPVVPGQLGVAKTAGLDFTYAILPDVYAIGDVGVTSNLVDSLIEPEINEPVYVTLGNPDGTPIYSAYDPILIHNSPTETAGLVPNQKQQALRLPFPNTGDVPSWNSGVLCVKPGSLVAVRFARTDVTDTENEYTGALGFINLRWTLVTVES